MNNGVESRSEMATNPVVRHLLPHEGGSALLFLLPLGEQHPDIRVDLADLILTGDMRGFNPFHLTRRFHRHGLPRDVILTDEAITVAREAYGKHMEELEALMTARCRDMANTARQLAQLLGLMPQRSRT